MSTRKRYDLCEKLKIIDEFKNGKTLHEICAKFQIAKSTACTIIKSKNKVLKSLKSTHHGTLRRQCLREGEYPKMEKQLYKWFVRKRENHITIDGNILKAKALKIHKKLHPDKQFSASNGWLCKFKKRYGIRLLKECGEKLSSNDEAVASFKEHLNELIQINDLSLDAVFNADESGLYWKMLPSQTLVHAGENSAPGRKISKERVTFLVCSNATGTMKIKPLVISKAKNPRSFKNKNLPVDYEHSKSAWMNAQIFKKWFFSKFVPQVEFFLKQKSLPPRAILLLDNAPSHPTETELVTPDGNIKVVYMPPNVTALIQPMDQNAIRLTKLFYRNCLLSRIVAEHTDINKALKDLKLIDAVEFLAISWNKVSADILKNCWRKILTTTEEFDEEDNIPLAELRYREENVVIETTLHIINEAFPESNFRREDLESWNGADECINVSDSEGTENVTFLSDEEETQNNQNTAQNKIKHADAIDFLAKSAQWAEENNEDYSHILILKTMQQKAFNLNASRPKTQTKISSFMKI